MKLDRRKLENWQRKKGDKYKVRRKELIGKK